MANELPPLSPEQRRQIFDEERARLLALPVLQPAPAPAAGTFSLSKGMIITLSVIGVLLVGAAVTHAFHSRYDDERGGSMHQSMQGKGGMSDDECPMMQQRGAQKETRMRRMEGDGMMRRDGSGQGQGGMMYDEQSEQPMMLERHFQMQGQGQGQGQGPMQGQQLQQEAIPTPNDGWMMERGTMQQQ